MTDQSIQAELDALKDANAFKDELLSIIAHDLRSPLGSIKGLLALLKNDQVTATERRAFTSELEATVDGSLQTLDNLLGWASQKVYGTISRAKTKDERLGIYALAAQAIHFVQYNAVKKNIRLVNNVPLHLQAIADAEQLSFVLRNLVGNAVKFSYDGAEVIIDAARRENMTEVSVMDTGIGIPGNRISSLFQVRNRSSRAGTDNEKGTGLGLIFCKEFIENNGGAIWAESNSRSGTTFKFTLKSAMPST